MVRKNLQRERTEENETRKAEGKEEEKGRLLRKESILAFAPSFPSCFANALLMTERLGYNPAALSGDKEGTHGLACPL